MFKNVGISLTNEFIELFVDHLCCKLIFPCNCLKNVRYSKSADFTIFVHLDIRCTSQTTTPLLLIQLFKSILSNSCNSVAFLILVSLLKIAQTDHLFLEAAIMIIILNRNPLDINKIHCLIYLFKILLINIKFIILFLFYNQIL